MEPFGYLLQLGGQFVLGHRLALLSLAILVPHRPPAAGFSAGRVDGDPQSISITMRSGRSGPGVADVVMPVPYGSGRLVPSR
jgi:hypothetical protein